MSSTVGTGETLKIDAECRAPSSCPGTSQLRRCAEAKGSARAVLRMPPNPNAYVTNSIILTPFAQRPISLNGATPTWRSPPYVPLALPLPRALNMIS